MQKILQARIDATSIQKLNTEGTAIGNMIPIIAKEFSSYSKTGDMTIQTNILQRVDFAHLIKDTTEDEMAS